MSTDEMDPLMTELHNMEVRFSKSANEREYAMFVLPSLETFLQIEAMDSGDINKMRSEIDSIVTMMAAMANIDEDDPHAMMKLAAAANATMYVVDDHGNADLRPSYMTDTEWRDHVIANTRVFRSDIGPYMVSTVFTGLRDDEAHGEHTLYETGVFDCRTTDLVDGLFCTNNKQAAYSVHGGFAHKWESIYSEESNDSK